MANDGSERRAFPRFRVSLFIRLRMGGERIVAARMLNISMSGLKCVADEDVDAPADVVAMINVPGAYPIEAEGRIVRKDDGPGGCEVAIAFVRIGPEDVPVLEQFLIGVQT